MVTGPNCVQQGTCCREECRRASQCASSGSEKGPTSIHFLSIPGDALSAFAAACSDPSRVPTGSSECMGAAGNNSWTAPGCGVFCLNLSVSLCAIVESLVRVFVCAAQQ